MQSSNSAYIMPEEVRPAQPKKNKGLKILLVIVLIVIIIVIYKKIKSSGKKTMHPPIKTEKYARRRQ